MSENTVNAVLRCMGYSKDEMTGHGFRSMASTILNEQGWGRDFHRAATGAQRTGCGARRLQLRRAPSRAAGRRSPTFWSPQAAILAVLATGPARSVPYPSRDTAKVHVREAPSSAKGPGPRPRQGLWKGRGSLCRTRWRVSPHWAEDRNLGGRLMDTDRLNAKAAVCDMNGTLIALITTTTVTIVVNYLFKAR
jgi:hypothetical protein